MPLPVKQRKQCLSQCFFRRYILSSVGILAAGLILNGAIVHVRVLSRDESSGDDDAVWTIGIVDPRLSNDSTTTSSSSSSGALEDQVQDLLISDGLLEAEEQDTPKEEPVVTAVATQATSNVIAGTSTAASSSQSQGQQQPRDRSISACLLIKDDGDILNEWIAYHYHALELRYLLVAVDPSSVTSPTPIFNHWRRHSNLTVVEWSDVDFMPASFLRKGYHLPLHRMDGDATKSKFHEGHEDAAKVKADNLQIANHRFRQLTFLSSCLRHMRDNGKTWTMHVDTDEFVVVNPLLRNTTQKNVRMIKVSPVVKSSSILDVVKQFNRNRALRRRFNYPCICMPRLLFGSVESSFDSDEPTGEVTSMFNASKFETLRWKYHTSYDDTERNAQPKVIVDVSAVALTDQMFSEPFSIHRPSTRLCRRIDQLDFTFLQRYPITVNHYTGSWERYFLAKNDTRRSKRAYDLKAHVADGHDDWIASWLDSFVQVHGVDHATTLLQDYTTSSATTTTSTGR